MLPQMPRFVEIVRAVGVTVGIQSGNVDRFVGELREIVRTRYAVT
jgi:phosphoserine phosphatase